MRRLIFILPLALLAVLTAYFAVGLTRDPAKVPSALIDQPAPVFELPPLPGHAEGFSSGHLAGEPQLVNVFASWCIPCKVEHPLLMRLAEEKGVTIRGINYKDAPEDALAFLTQLGDPYASVGADRTGRVGIDWGVYGVPETFVVDAQGRIRYKHVGPLDARTVNEVILPLLEQLKVRTG